MRSLLPVFAPAALLIGAGAGAGVPAALTTGGGAPGRPSGTPVVRPMSSYGGTLQGRLQRLLRDSEESGEARVSRAELEQMLDWTQKARGGLAGAPP